MATRYGVSATKILNTTPVDLGNQAAQGSRLYVIYDSIAISAVTTAADIIKMGAKIPAGARVLDAYIDTADLDAQSAGAMTLGWAASEQLDSTGTAVEAASSAGLISSIDTHTAATTKALNSIIAATCAGKFKKFSAAVQPQLTITGTGDATSGSIFMTIYYVID